MIIIKKKYQTPKVNSITILFSVLISFVIVIANELRLLRREIDVVNNKIMFVASATDEQISTLAEDVGQDIHEVFVAIANKRDEEDH